MSDESFPSREELREVRAATENVRKELMQFILEVKRDLYAAIESSRREIMDQIDRARTGLKGESKDAEASWRTT